jgi:hypothetical protein
VSERGLLIEFDSADALQRARDALLEDGWMPLDAFTPTPPAENETAPALYPRSLPIAALFGGLVGGIGCFAMECYAAMVGYPINVAGRPDASLIAFVPPALETTLLGAAMGVVIAFLFAARLPRFHHPLFDVEDFAHASDHRYFLLIDAHDGQRERLHDRLRALRAVSVHEVRDDA